MFGIGMPELIIIFVIALLVFGPKELPKIGRTIGRAMAEFRRASDELRDGIQREIEMAEREEPEATQASVNASAGSASADSTLSSAMETSAPTGLAEPIAPGLVSDESETSEARVPTEVPAESSPAAKAAEPPAQPIESRNA